jgi:hypothetical protein
MITAPNMKFTNIDVGLIDADGATPLLDELGQRVPLHYRVALQYRTVEPSVIKDAHDE